MSPSSTPVLNAQGQPIRSALKCDDDLSRTPPTGPTKAVQIAEPEHLPQEEPSFKRQFSASVSGKRLSGRPAMPSSSSRPSFLSQNSIETLDLDGNQGLTETPDEVPAQEGAQQQSSAQHRVSQKVDRVSEKLVSQIAEWLQREKVKRESRKPRKHHHHHHHHLRRKHKAEAEENSVQDEPEPEPEVEISLRRTTSLDSNASDVSLDRLQRILDDSMAALGLNSVSHLGSKIGRRESRRSKKYGSRPSMHLSRGASSDTDYVDGDVLVPSCDAVLDNTKTLKYCQASAGADDSASICGRREEKERQVWTTFKNEIIRLAHTLRLKGWRRVALDSGDDITVERLSGALTNAVYVVTPPETLPDATEHVTKKKPPKLLLRIYGPNVEHLIDRDNELQILKRLARKKIGPRLLGTFTNGRFEQYFNAEPLTPEALREPSTSKQIAKRMRELHQGVDLLEEEKDGGPTVFKNWDCWVDNVAQRSLFLDQQTLSQKPDTPIGPGEAWKQCGFVCGTEWATFKAMVDRYREFLIQSYGGSKAMREKLVFAHNDTQYGNILRVRPDDERSPLLHPENEHKQLIVIDFEYASANLPGLEFANHFTEWAYNYHDERTSHACNVDRLYPTPEQQARFVAAYVEHRPKLPNPNSHPLNAGADAGGSADSDVTPSATPLLGATPSSSSIVEFMLDARVPPGGWTEQERRATDAADDKVQELLGETRLWRAMNSAQWVAWGIVQAKIPGYNCGFISSSSSGGKGDDNSNNDGEEKEGKGTLPIGTGGETENGSAGKNNNNGGGGGVSEEEEGFDYLSYAHDRALFFWGDCVQMGLVKLEELPKGLRERVKIVEY